MLGYPDSNQERQDQNLQCYHYTIAQLRGQSYNNFLWLLFQRPKIFLLSVILSYFDRNCRNYLHGTFVD